MFIVISGPSGSGKTPLLYSVTETYPNVKKVQSYTTRKTRKSEVAGTYIYMTQPQFLEMVAEGFFLEYNRVHKDQQYYGTGLDSFKKALENEGVAIKDVDVDSYKTLKKNKALDVVGIYVTVKDRGVLFDRLRERGESEQTINIRLHDRVDYENSQSKFYDYVVYTDNMADAIKILHEIIDAEFKKRGIKVKKNKFVIPSKIMF